MRTEEEIERGALPGVEFITLGGRAYPALEPTNARARIIRKVLVDYDNARQEKGKNVADQMELVEAMIDACLKNFSDEIEADWERIARTATDSERVKAVTVVRDSVMVCFTTLAETATPVGNRKARREKK